jgi:hypothetical protein
MNTTDTTTDIFDDNPLAPATEAPLQPAAAKFTEEMALDWLTANANSAKPVREIAQIWGWHRSRVQRFLSRFRETSGETKALSRETSGETPPLSRETPETPDEAGFDYRLAECVLPMHTSVFAYVDQETGDLWIAAEDALRRCDTELRINAEDVATFVDTLVVLVEPGHREH